MAVALLTAFLSACKSKIPEHGHEQGPNPLAYTLYSDKLEIFVEFPPLVVGNTSKFAAHFTILGEKFLPLSEGTVSISLVVGEKGIKHVADTPTVPGIYRLALKPGVVGTGKLIFDITTKSFTDQIIIDNVSVYADEKTAIEMNPEEKGSNDITYLKEQAWKVEFANARIKKQAFSNIIKTNGLILSAPGDEIMVTAKASGIVLFSGKSSIIGSKVNTGMNLFAISGGDLTMENIDANYKEAKDNYEKAKLDYDRSNELIKDKIISQKDFQDVKLKYDIAKIAYQTLAKNYSTKGQIVSSPINGFVKDILVTEGQYVVSGTPLAIISKNKKLILQANVSQKYFDKLSSIASANFQLAGNEKVLSTSDLNGRVISYGKSASANSPFIPVSFEIDNIGNIISGSVAEVYLKSYRISDALVIPVSSLIEEQGIFYVYVQTGGERFQKREVTLGASDGIHVQLLTGVLEGERVVTKGAYQIKLSTAAGTLPAHGHEH